MLKIGVYPFPFSSKNNKYISLLYTGLSRAAGDFKCEIINCDNKFSKLLKLSKNSAKFDKNIVHIHWVNSIYGSRFLPKSIILMVLNFLILVFVKKIKKFKIFWTKHNYYSHDFSYPFIDRIGRRILFGLADKIIVQQESEYERVKQNKKFAFIPHGNYIGAYGPLGDRQRIRRKLGIGDDQILILSLGIVKPYKKIDSVINAFKKTAGPDLKLLIAGQCSEDYAEILKNKADGSDNILFNLKFIEDGEIPDYFAAADFSVFWYDGSVLTSGGIMLSLSYGVPVIARNMPASELIKNNENGFIYDTETQLTSILNNIKLSQFNREKIISSMENLSWEHIAGKLAEEFQKNG